MGVRVIVFFYLCRDNKSILVYTARDKKGIFLYQCTLRKSIILPSIGQYKIEASHRFRLFSLFTAITAAFLYNIVLNLACIGHRLRSSLSEERRESSMSDDRRYSYLMEQVHL